MNTFRRACWDIDDRSTRVLNSPEHTCEGGAQVRARLRKLSLLYVVYQSRNVVPSVVEGRTLEGDDRLP